MPRKLLLIGLDALDLDVARPLMESGRMPHLAGLIERGASGILTSTIPPVSAPAWASFLTGVHPGRHGLYSFVVEREVGADTQLANISDIRGPKIWDYVAVQGARPVVANVPVTWPPPEFDGVLVTGMLTPEAREVAFTHPPELGDAIRAAVPGYRIDIDRTMLDDRPTLFESLRAMTRQRRDLFVHLLRTEAWDLNVSVFTNTDRVQHSFWRKERDQIDAFFAEVDTYVGDLLAEVDLDETVVMLMSDHGFQGAKYKLYVNRFLEDAGLLATRRSVDDDAYARRRPDYFDDFQGGQGDKAKPEVGRLGGVLAKLGVGGKVVMDWPRTRAFLWSLDTGGVGINLRSRYAHGIVEDADYEAVRDEVIGALTALRLPDGEAAFRTVRRREEVYHGDFAHLAPDVVVEWSDALDLGIQLDAKEAVRSHRREEGHHSPRGFICVAGPGCRTGTTIAGSIVDCLPTALHAMGLKVPVGLDGQVLVEAFDDDRDVETFTPDLALDGGSGPGFSESEEEELRRSLEGLGYL